MDTPPFAKLGDWYGSLDPAKRKKLTLFGGVAGFVLVSAIMVTATSDNNSLSILKQPRKVEYTLFNGKKPRDVSIDAMSGRINKLTDDVNEIRQTFQRQEQQNKDILISINKQTDEMNKRTDMLNQQTSDLFGKLESGKVPLPSIKDKGNTIGEPSYQEPLPSMAGLPANQAGNQNGAVNAPIGPKIRVVTAAGEGAANTTASTNPNGQGRKINEFVNIRKAAGNGAAPDMFLPAGSIVSGTLVTGLDAPTSNQTRDDPFPVLIRIKHQAVLPNLYKMDIRECFLIGSGYGDLSSERAYIRSERISCVKKDGGIIETSIDAYSVGEDGKTGIRGRLVSKNGQLIGNALLSGFISGLSTAFAPQSISSLQTSIIPGQQQAYQYPSPQYIGGQALAGGVKGAATQIAQYYLDMAKNIFPIIEIDAGRKVDFVLVRGMEMKTRRRGGADDSQANIGQDIHADGSSRRQAGVPGVPGRQLSGNMGGNRRGTSYPRQGNMRATGGGYDDSYSDVGYNGDNFTYTP